MLTEQKPPCAAQLGVPKLVAHRLVRDWLWSRPVKKASFLGSLARTGASHETARSSASSQPISLNRPSPRSPTRSSGARSRAGEQMLLDAGRTLAADHAAVHRMVGIAVDVADGAVLEMHPDPAAAGAHVAGGRHHLVGHLGRGVDPLARAKVALKPAAQTLVPP